VPSLHDWMLGEPRLPVQHLQSSFHARTFSPTSPSTSTFSSTPSPISHLYLDNRTPPTRLSPVLVTSPPPILPLRSRPVRCHSSCRAVAECVASPLSDTTHLDPATFNLATSRPPLLLQQVHGKLLSLSALLLACTEWIIGQALPLPKLIY
jgi:hypothetical protein